MSKQEENITPIRRPLLDMSTFTPPREYMTIDGEVYEFITEEDMTLVGQVNLGALGNEMRGWVFGGRRINRRDEARVRREVDAFMQEIFFTPVPREVLDRLTLNRKLVIVQAFFAAVMGATGEEEETTTA